MQPPVMAPPRAALEATDLVKTYGSGGTAVRALDGVTATFVSAELTAIMGPSGSGKSTLMHCLAGLDTPTSGSVRTDPGSGEAARARLYHYYQHTARRAATLTTLTPRPGPDGPAPAHAPPLPDAETAWAWLRAERANLLAAIDHAGRRNLGPDLITLTAGLATVLHADSPGPQAAILHQTAAAVAGRLGDHRSQAGALTDLGDVVRRTGDYPGATDALTQALQIYRDIGNRGNEAWALNHYAAAVRADGDLIRALELYQQALTMNRELGKPDDEAIALEGTGECLLAQGRIGEGAACLRQALDLYQRLGMRADAERLTAHLTASARLPAPETG